MLGAGVAALAVLGTGNTRLRCGVAAAAALLVERFRVDRVVLTIFKWR